MRSGKSGIVTCKHWSVRWLGVRIRNGQKGRGTKILESWRERKLEKNGSWRERRKRNRAQLLRKGPGPGKRREEKDEKKGGN